VFENQSTRFQADSDFLEEIKKDPSFFAKKRPILGNRQQDIIKQTGEDSLVELIDQFKLIQENAPAIVYPLTTFHKGAKMVVVNVSEYSSGVWVFLRLGRWGAREDRCDQHQCKEFFKSLQSLNLPRALNRFPEFHGTLNNEDRKPMYGVFLALF
jgi:hypothetical protein